MPAVGEQNRRQAVMQRLQKQKPERRQEQAATQGTDKTAFCLLGIRIQREVLKVALTKMTEQEWRNEEMKNPCKCR